MKWPPPKIKLTCNEYQQYFDDWYAEHIEPLGPGFEVFAEDYSTGNEKIKDECWLSKNISNQIQRDPKTKGILIGIELIKEKTAEDILREIISELDLIIVSPKIQSAVLAKAREYLARKK